MDPLTHLVVTTALVGWAPAGLLASLGPDLPWYILYPAWLLGRRGVKAALSTGVWPLPPRWVQEVHYAAHSLPMLALGLIMGRIAGVRRPKAAAGWLLHILVDIPTHSRKRMGTRVFWPLSSWTYDGISWGDGVARLVAALWRKWG